MSRIFSASSSSFVATAPPSDRPAVMRAAECVGRVEQQLQPPAIGNLRKAFDVARTPPEMHAQDASGPRGNQLLDPLWIESMRGGVDVAEDRRDLLPLQCVGRCDKGRRGQDHLAAQI
jgi:hypothetical protein